VQLQEYAGNDWRILRLPPGGKRLPERMKNLQSLGEQEKLQQRMHEQLGIRLAVAPGVNEVRSMRGIRIEIDTLPASAAKPARHYQPPSAAWKNTRRLPTSCLTPMACFGVFEQLKDSGCGWVGIGTDRRNGQLAAKSSHPSSMTLRATQLLEWPA